MSLNITANLQPKMDYFVGDLKSPRKSLGRIVGAFPQVLLLYCCFTAALLLLYFKNLYTVFCVPAAPHPQPRQSPDAC